MATQQAQPAAPKPRVPLLASTGNRGLTARTDTQLINGYVEKTPDGEVVLVKRPGFVLTWAHASEGRGAYWWKGVLYFVVGGTLYANNAALGAVNALGGMYTFSSCMGAVPKLILHNSTNAYYTSGGAPVAIALPATPLVPGAAYLDGTTYFGTALEANIYGSGINDPATWNPLNVIKAQQEPDELKYVTKQLSYTIAMKEWTIEGFWDAGNTVGSPLSPAQGTLMPFGCKDAASVQEFENVIIWVAQTRAGSVSVMMMEGMRAQTISTPAIERLLQTTNWSPAWSWSARINGHRFYAITLKQANFTLVYDLTTGLWFQWGLGVAQSYMPIVDASWNSTFNWTYLQHENGSIYVMSGAAVKDDNLTIYLDLYTGEWDGGVRTKKFLKRMDFLADRRGAGKIKIRHSEDDYTNWSNFREVDLSKKVPHLDDCGTFVKRAWHIRHQEDTPLRLEAIELTPMLGA